MDRAIRWICVTSLLINGAASLQQTVIDRLANDIAVKAEVVTNLASSGEHSVRISLKNTGSDDIQTGWTIYFHSFYVLFPKVFPGNKTYDRDLDNMRFRMIHGDLYAFEPLPGFEPIKPGRTREIMFDVQWWSISRTDFSPNWYITSLDGSGEPRIVTSTRDTDFVVPFNKPQQWKRYENDKYDPFTAQDRKNRLGVNDAKKALKMIIPTPKTTTLVEGGTKTNVNTQWRIYGATPEEKQFAKLLSDLIAIATTENLINTKIIRLSQTPQSGVDPESYRIQISGEIITLTGYGAPGLFYAVQSLSSLLLHYDKTAIPQMTIEDEPRFPYRGMYIDVARNFHTVEDLKRLMTTMAMYKLNKLHVHLADDEGWRLDIPGLPELTQITSKRCHDLQEHTCIIPQYGSGPFTNTSGTGYYTAEDYKAILQFAKDNFIEIVPEFDMPGHAHAAIIAMENRYRIFSAAGNTAKAEEYRLADPDDESKYLSTQAWTDNAINPCIESTYKFITKLVDEVKVLHSSIQPLTTYHFGGDEVAGGAWEKSPKCVQFLQANPAYNVSKGLKRYFAERVAAITGKAGVGMRGWEDGYMDKDSNPFPLSAMNNTDMSANPWDNIWEWGASQRAYRLANAGYKVIMSQATDLYFDHPQEPDPEERGLYWATRFTDTYKVFGFLPDSLYDNIKEERSGKVLTKAEVCGEDMSKCDQLEKTENVIGMQGHLWSETIIKSEYMDYMIFPRLLALAERAWHKARFESPGLDTATRTEVRDADWMEFANTLGYKELKRLDDLGVMYRVPPPGASIENGQVQVTTTFPGLTVQYKREDENQWRDVTDDVIEWKADGKAFFLKTLSADKLRESRHVQLKEEPSDTSDGRQACGQMSLLVMAAVALFPRVVSLIV